MPTYTYPRLLLSLIIDGLHCCYTLTVPQLTLPLVIGRVIKNVRIDFIKLILKIFEEVETISRFN